VRLRLHPTKCVVLPVDEGLPFLGYVVWPDRIRVRGETVRRFRRRFRRRGTLEHRDARARLAVWRGHVGIAGTWRRATPG